MPRVARCDECRKLFDIPEDQAAPEEVDQVQSAGLLRATKVFLCPPCRQAARERGQPPAPPEPPAAAEAEEAPQEQPPEEEPPA